jgi:hypothetical protein
MDRRYSASSAGSEEKCDHRQHDGGTRAEDDQQQERGHERTSTLLRTQDAEPNDRVERQNYEGAAEHE